MQREEAVLIVDDTIVAKPHTDENDLICWHFDHSLEKTVKGINFVATLYCVPQPCSPTRTVRTQSNHLFCMLFACVKWETLKIKTKCHHFALKSKLYLTAL